MTQHREPRSSGGQAADVSRLLFLSDTGSACSPGGRFAPDLSRLPSLVWCVLGEGFSGHTTVALGPEAGGRSSVLARLNPQVRKRA